MCGPTHCASDCAPCHSPLRAFPRWIRSPPPTKWDRARPCRFEARAALRREIASHTAIEASEVRPASSARGSLNYTGVPRVLYRDTSVNILDGTPVEHTIWYPCTVHTVPRHLASAKRARRAKRSRCVTRPATQERLKRGPGLRNELKAGEEGTDFYITFQTKSWQRGRP